MSTPVIIDCDPGHDDVFALWLAAGNPSIDLLGVTTVCGNGRVEDTTRNARIALTVAGVEGVPVAAGAEKPLYRDLTTASWIHGDNALGGPELPAPTVPVDHRIAIDLISDILVSASEPVTVIATGPLTNIATLLQERPTLRARIKEIIWMGGSTGRGYVGAYAEFNAWVDPEAADIVFRSGLPITMVGLNITAQAPITQEVMDMLAAIGNETCAFGVELLRYFSESCEKVVGLPDAPLHDPITVAIAIDRSIATIQRSHVDIETKGEFTSGATAVDLHNTLGKKANTDIAMTLDVERFWRLLRESIANLE